MKLIDLHSHILYGIDDGSKELENSVVMAREASESGITHICCTPHYLEPNFISNWEENEKRLEILQSRLKEENIDLELRLGNEIFITENTIDDITQNRALKLNESRYVLVEFPMVNELKCCDKIIDKLILMGLKVIIAHPERYKYVQENPDYLIPYLEKGVIFQSNIGSIIGMYGESAKQCINTLLKRNMIQALSTDAHKSNSVYKKIEKISEKMKEKISKEYFEELTLINPQKILNDEDIEIRKFKKKKKFIFF